MDIFELQYPGTWLKLADEDKAWEISKLLISAETVLTEVALSLGLFEEEMKKVTKDFGLDKIRQQLEHDQTLRTEIENRYINELGVEMFYKNYASLSMKINLETREKKWQDGGMPESYRHQLPFIYAHSFLYALDSLGKFLDVIANEDGVPQTVCSIRDEFYASLPSLRKIRNSALHIEDRSRGFGTVEQTRRKKRMKLQPVSNRMINASGGTLILSNLNENRLGYTIDDGSFQEIEISKTTLNVAGEALQKLINSFVWYGSPQFKPY